MSAPAPVNAVKSYRDIKGWFNWQDKALFTTLLAAQDGDAPGVLVELGGYLGRSAVVIGEHLRPDERFVVVDLFGDGDVDALDGANRRENQKSYRTLTRQKFEENYLAVRGELPEIVQGLSSEIIKHVEPKAARFVHVDASHLYGMVAEDIANAREILRDDGLVVFDDFRAEHTPGVAAAVWEAVATGGLVPVVLTARKFYGVWGDPARYLDVVRRFVDGDNRLATEEQSVHGHTLVRIKSRVPGAAAKPAPASAPIDDKTLDRMAERVAQRLSPILAPGGQGRSAGTGGSVRRVVAAVLPTPVRRWIRARRKAAKR